MASVSYLYIATIGYIKFAKVTCGLNKKCQFLTEDGSGVRTYRALQLKARRFNLYAKAPNFILIGTKKDGSTCGYDSGYTPVTTNKNIETGITDFNLKLY